MDMPKAGKKADEAAPYIPDVGRPDHHVPPVLPDHGAQDMDQDQHSQ